MDSISKVEYNVRNLSTRSVTLFPTRAQVFRDIKDVPLQPGLNEITIYGLTPTVDEHSIKVEGSGSAIISDIAVESLPNREIFEEIYPDEDEDKSSDDEDADDMEEPDIPESKELQAAVALTKTLEHRLKQIEEAGESTNQQQKILDDYSGTVTAKDDITIESFLDSYKRICERISTDNSVNTRKEEDLRAELRRQAVKTERLRKQHRVEKKKASKGWKKAALAKTKSKIQAARREEERIKEKERIRKERESFWPKYCYAVRIQLTSNSVATPMSSRRGSISSETEYAMPVSSPGAGDTEMSGGPATTHCSLVLSYVTASAFWTPGYDLQLSTTTGTGTLCFDAQLNNTTSETWNKCKITLSTSNVSTSSLEETAPLLVPWRIKIGQSPFPDTDLLQSREERQHYSKFWQQQQPVSTKQPRTNMFGVAEAAPASLQDYQMQLMLLEQQNKKRMMMARQEQDNGPIVGSQGKPTYIVGSQGKRPSSTQQQQQQMAVQQMAMQQQQQQQMQQQMQQQQVQPQQAPMQVIQPQQTGWRPTLVPPPAQSSASALFGSSSNNNNNGASMNFAADQSVPPPPAGRHNENVLNDFDFDSFMHEDGGEPRLDFEESLVDETGFTTTYDLPGLKTLAPRSTSSKQRVARINFNKIIFSHTVIAKYKPVAHLSAKLLNSSKLTLLRGPVGVTLDGSFMGRTNLPRCGSGDSINLGLGADPAIKVTYPRPESKRATTGFFTKEDIKIFERCIRLENTRQASGPAAKPVKVIVMDQIPVPDNERVRVELLKPEGLAVGEQPKATGVPGRERNEEDKDWGSAVSSLRKGGEVHWVVSLKPGKALKLPLEYLVAVPIGEQAVQS